MKGTKSKLQYKRMWENKGHRPWWSVLHVEVPGEHLKTLTGFGYKNQIFIVNAEMSNSAYFEVAEMSKATEHFDGLFRDKSKTRKMLDEIKRRYNEAETSENWAWTQNWSEKSDQQLLMNIDRIYSVVLQVFACVFVSQPQHVISLERRIHNVIGDNQNANEILREVTYYKGEMPWTREKSEIEKYHNEWSLLSEDEREKILKNLVSSYGWLNDIEGDTPFDTKHYKKEIKEFTKESEYQSTGIEIQQEVKTMGALIGELGHLRFWGRWHFMHLRYHIKMILSEIISRTKVPDLEYATIDEIRRYLEKQDVDLSEISARKKGYVSVLIDEKTKIITGKSQDRYIRLCSEIAQETEQIKGTVANKGKASGKVRIISFSAPDYNKQVASFEKGEILVTGMTRPQIVHLCKKAAAIVTDEGGITSHAAVVSREFGIPCIIATHNATRILKTGDLVEVDADRGVVRKINN